jgi:protein required for attachment to host cells
MGNLPTAPSPTALSVRQDAASATHVEAAGRHPDMPMRGRINARFTMLQPKRTTWVVVADGARAFIVANRGPGTGLSPVPGTAREHGTPKTSELGSDRPGRSFNSDQSGLRHGMEPRVDWHQFEKQKFAHSIARLLDDARNRRAFDRLVLVAPPETLGELRAKLDKHTQALVAGEIAKDLTRHMIEDLPQHLDGVLKV